jgi:hypothetical protein
METMVFDQMPSARSLPNLDKLTVWDGYFARRRAEARAAAGACVEPTLPMELPGL